MLSIIIPTLNEKDYLPYLLDSIKRQNLEKGDYEIIVADAGSKDETKEIARKEGCFLVEGGLPAVGRNKGAIFAKGDILLFLDADVILPSDFLKEALKEFQRRKLDIASCFVLPLSNEPIDDILYGIGNFYYELNQYIKPQAPGYCIFIKKEFHNKVNGFDEEIKIGEDWDYITRVSQLGKFKFLRNIKIPLSMRRFERDGRLNVALQRLTEVMYISLFGNIKSDKLLKYYRFGNYPKKVFKPK